MAHSSLAIIAHTYASVLTEIARQAADAIAARIPSVTTDSAEPANTPRHDRTTAGPAACGGSLSSPVRRDDGPTVAAMHAANERRPGERDSACANPR